MKIGKIWKDGIQGYSPWRDSKGFEFRPERANAACRFFERYLKQSKGEFAGIPFKLEAWQRKAVGHLFAWVRPDGTRRYRKMFIYVPRKNGKSTLAAGLGLQLFIADDEPGAEVYCAAADTSQASLVFNEASKMVAQNAELADEVRVYAGYKSMVHEATGSHWRVLSSEAGTKHGLNPSGVIIDEVHAQKKSELMEVLETGTGARRQPLTIYLSTADYGGPSPCNNLVSYARKVRDGLIEDPEFLPVLYEADSQKDDWKDESVWWKANPNLGVSLKLEYLRSQFRKALEEPSFENTFKRLHLNMQTEQERRWLKIEDWDLSGSRIERESLKGRRCFGAIDLSSVSDITALALFFPDECACLCWFWVPAKTAKKRIEYELWARQGYIEIVDTPVVEYREIRNMALRLKDEYQVEAWAFDPWNAAQVANAMSNEDGLRMVEFRQGYKTMNEPAKEFEKLVIQHKIVHFGNPVLRWMAANAQIMEDPAGNIKPTKPQKDSPLKIDGIICLVMGVGLSISKPGEKPSVYEERGVRMV